MSPKRREPWKTTHQNPKLPSRDRSARVNASFRSDTPHAQAVMRNERCSGCVLLATRWPHVKNSPGNTGENSSLSDSQSDAQWEGMSHD